MATILAVEDNPAHLALITDLMAEFGHVPIAANDAETGLRMIEQERPDLVLCDIRLPTLSGYDILRRIKSDPATRHVPVIAVTAVAGKGETLQAGFDGYLSKPFSMRRLRLEIERVAPALGVSDSARSRNEKGAGAPVAWAKTLLPRSGKRILVLDNTEGNRELMRAVLDYGGHDVVCERTVSAAFATALSWRPHLILSDLHLDKELGTELLSAVQNTAELLDTRFAFTSASPGPSVEQELLQTGACAYLRFPMKAEALLWEVGRLLGE